MQTCNACGSFPASGDEGLCGHCWAYDMGVIGWRMYLDTFYRAADPEATRKVLLKVREDRRGLANRLVQRFEWVRVNEVVDEIREIDAELEIVARG